MLFFVLMQKNIAIIFLFENYIVPLHRENVHKKKNLICNPCVLLYLRIASRFH